MKLDARVHCFDFASDFGQSNGIKENQRGVFCDLANVGLDNDDA